MVVDDFRRNLFHVLEQITAGLKFLISSFVPLVNKKSHSNDQYRSTTTGNLEFCGLYLAEGVIEKVSGSMGDPKEIIKTPLG